MFMSSRYRAISKSSFPAQPRQRPI